MTEFYNGVPIYYGGWPPEDPTGADLVRAYGLWALAERARLNPEPEPA